MTEIELNHTKLKEFMRLKPTLADTAAFFEVSERTIDRYLRQHFDCNFKDFRERYMVHTRMQVVRKAIELATKGNVTMLIFCLKNLCGWKDKYDDSDDKEKGTQPGGVILTNEQLKELVKAARGAK